MNERTRRRLVVGTLAAAWLAGLADQVLVILNRSTWSGPTEALDSGLVLGGMYAAAGALILLKNPRHAVGRTALYIGLVVAISQLAGDYAVYSRLILRRPLPLDAAAAWIGQWGIYLAIPGAIALLLLFFPDGLPSRRRWWPVMATAVGSATLLAGGLMFQDGLLTPGSKHTGLDVGVSNPVGFLSIDAASSLQGIGWLLGAVALVASVLAVALRFRGADAERRQQLKWLTICAVPIAPTFVVHFIALFFNLGHPDLISRVYVVGIVVGVPAAMGVAVLKYRLYDIDVVISRTLVYGSLAVFITAVYVGLAVGVGSLIGSGGKPNLGLSILATAIVAVAFQPVRERVQKVANRLVYGKRATPYEVLSEFGGRVAESYAGDEVLARMARVLGEGTGAELTEVWLRGGGVLQRAAAWPDGAGAVEPVAVTGQVLPAIPGADRAVPVRHQGELLGALTVSKRRGESLTPIEDKLLADLGHQAGLVLKNVGLTADLQARLVDLRASRQRLVAAQDQERRRIERNLHDGAQQHLVALKVKLGLTEAVARKDPQRVAAMLSDLKADADEALETLRDLARGIYPPLLAERGLGAALKAQARKATLPVEVDVDGIGRYPEEVESAVYFCCLEALQNVQKYAHASAASVHLGRDGDTLTLAVEDDGIGFDPTRVARGSGLRNIEDRIDALGGKSTVNSTPGGGTRLAARLPAVPIAVAT